MFKRILLLIALLVSTAAAKDQKFLKAEPVHVGDTARKWADRTLKKMSLEQKVGQIIFVQQQARFMNLDSPEHQRLRDLIRRFHLGGINLSVPVESGVLIKTLPYEAAVWVNTLQQDSELPLIITADFERGPSMRMNGTTVFPHAMAFGATGKPELAEKFGEIVAQESRALGVEWNLFPVADVNSNPANPIINTRSFGEDPKLVGDFVTAYINGARKFGMLSTAKHFPGHGDTATDSHLSLAQVSGDKARLQSVELPPFKRAVDDGIAAVMVAHVTVPALEPAPNRVATTSPTIVTDLLRNQLGFKGIVMTDALDMNALAGLYVGAGAGGQGRAAVDSFKAGNDIILQPSNIEAAFTGLLNAAKSGEIPRSRLDDSVRKILIAKASVGLNKARFVNLEQVNKIVGRPENVAFGQSIADQAIALVRDNGRLLPLRRSPSRGTNPSGLTYGTVAQVSNRVLAVIFTDTVASDVGRTFERELRARVPDATVMYVDPRIANPMSQAVLAAADQAQAVIAVVAIAPSAGKMVQVNGQLTNTVALDDATGSLLRGLLQHTAPKLEMIALGSPYVAQEFPQVQNYLCTFSNEKVSEISAVKALFGEIPVHGRLPVTIPNIAQRGAGINRDLMAQGGQNAVSLR